MSQIPPEHVAARWEALIDYLRDGKLPFQAARAAGVPHKALTQRLRSDPDFVEDYDAAMAEAAEEYEDVIRQAAKAPPPEYDPDTKTWRSFGPYKDAVNAAEKWLKARQRVIWSPDKNTTVTHNVNVSLSSPDDVRALQARLEERQRKAVQAWTPGFLQANPVGSVPADADVVDAEIMDDPT